MPPLSPLLRIIDANANRAREALRVIEDIARFALDNPALSAQIKTLRHGLRAALTQPALDQGLRLAARDSENDPGRDTKTPEELTRGGLRDVAAAACARLTESLRSLEEATKTLEGADPRPIELLRYRAYEVEKRLLLLLPTGRAPQWRLCVLITESLCTPHRGAGGWLGVARAAIAGGADCIQLREKELDSRELLHRARALRAITGAARCSLIINDRPDIAVLSGADGVHLGQADISVQDARRLVGFRLLIGISTTNMEQATAAAQGAPQSGSADYCGVGPMFASTTKDKPVAGPEYLREYLTDPITSQRPHLAIGGITTDNIHELVAAGCRGVAVSSTVCGAKDPAGVCRELVEAIKQGVPSPFED